MCWFLVIVAIPTFWIRLLSWKRLKKYFPFVEMVMMAVVGE